MLQAQLDSARYYEYNADYVKALNFYIAWHNNATDTLSDIWFDSNLAMAKCYRLNGMLGEGLLAFEKGINNAVVSKKKYYELKYRIYLADYFLWVDELTSLKYSNSVKETELIDYPNLWVIHLHRRAALFNVLKNFKKNKLYADTAFVLAERSLKKAKEIGFEDAQATCYNELADLNESAGRFTLSLSYYDSAAYIFKKNNNLVDYVNVNINLSRLYLKMNQLPKVIKILDKAIPIAEQFNWYFHLYPLYDTKKKYYLAIGDSLNYYKNWVYNVKNYNQSIRKRTESELLKVQTQFSVKEKERNLEIKNQQYISEKIKKQRLTIVTVFLAIIIAIVIYFYFSKKRDAEKLAKLLNENRFLLGESNHRIKNNLQLIVSLLARETLTQKGSEITKLQEIASKIESIATLHQQLYTHDKKSVILLNEYLTEIMKNFEGFLDSRAIKYQLNSKVGEVSIEKAMYLGLLLVELVINSLKYAFIKENSNPELVINVTEKNNTINFSYYDNGVGIKQGQKLKLVTLLSQQLKAMSNVSAQKGFHFTLQFKV